MERGVGIEVGFLHVIVGPGVALEVEEEGEEAMSCLVLRYVCLSRERLG